MRKLIRNWIKSLGFVEQKELDEINFHLNNVIFDIKTLHERTSICEKWSSVDVEIDKLQKETFETRLTVSDAKRDLLDIINNLDVSSNVKIRHNRWLIANNYTELSHKLADLRLVVQELQATEDALELNTPKVRVVKVKGKNAYQLKYITEKPTHYVIGTNKGYATIKSISKGIERKVKIWTPKKEA